MLGVGLNAKSYVRKKIKVDFLRFQRQMAAGEK